MDANFDELSCYAVYYQNAEPNFYARIPGVIYHATYLDEKGERQRLSPRARDLYCYLKQIGGRSNQCWQDTSELAEALGCSRGTISNLKKELCKPIEQLENKPLIQIKESYKTGVDESGKKWRKTHHKITIVDIWRENNGFMGVYVEGKKHGKEIKPRALTPDEIKDIEEAENVDNLGADSHIERAEPPDSHIESAHKGAGSNIGHINRVTEKDQLCNISDQPATAGDDCSLPSENSVNDLLSKSKFDLAKEAKTDTERAIVEMQFFGFDANFIREMVKRRIPFKQIMDGINYTKEMMRLGKVKVNKLGYARKMIEKKKKWHGEKGITC